MKTRDLLAVVSFLFAALAAQADPPTHDDSFTKEDLFKADVNDLKDTQLVAHPGVPLDPTKNVLWCGTLQLAWNEAIDLVGEKLHFTTSSPTADLLNREDFTRADLDPSSYVAIADFERNHVEDEIRAALNKTFGGAASPELIPDKPDNPGPDDFVAYAYLFKKLAFETPFLDQELAFEGHPFKAFGFSSEAGGSMTSQVEIFDYKSPDDFILSLKSKSPTDQLILAKVKPGATLEATCQNVLERMKARHPIVVMGNADMDIPFFNFDLRRHFDELEGLTLQPSPAAKIKDRLFVKKVEQLVRFQLNENGAVLKSEAVIEMTRGIPPPPQYELIFDKPFLILIKQKDSAQPYFALWVGNATLLIPEKK